MPIINYITYYSAFLVVGGFKGLVLKPENVDLANSIPAGKESNVNSRDLYSHIKRTSLRSSGII